MNEPFGHFIDRIKVRTVYSHIITDANCAELFSEGYLSIFRIKSFKNYYRLLKIIRIFRTGETVKNFTIQ